MDLLKNRRRGHDYNGDYYRYDDIQTQVLHQNDKNTTNLSQEKQTSCFNRHFYAANVRPITL
jgi:hypothetical protein